MKIDVRRNDDMKRMKIEGKDAFTIKFNIQYLRKLEGQENRRKVEYTKGKN